MSKKLNLDDLKDILVGASLLGSGGGGPIIEGYDLLDKLEAENITSIDMISIDEMDDGYATFVAILGPLSVDDEDLDYTPQCIKAIECMKKASEEEGKDIKYMMSGELGGSNTAVSMYLAGKMGMPLIDVDGQGRAVPELNTSLQYLYDIPAKPLVFAGGKGDKIDEIRVNLSDPLNCIDAERIARSLSMSYGDLIAFTTWPLNSEDMKNCSIPGAMTLSREIGELFRMTKESGKDIGMELVERFEFEELFRGEITDVEYDDGGGFDSGIIVVESESNKFKIFFKNENMVVKNAGGQIMANVPDLICLADLDSIDPVTNVRGDVRKGRRITCLKRLCHENWSRNQRSYEVWNDILKEIN